MSNRYHLAPTDSLRGTYRAIDRASGSEVALHPATLPNGAPHPEAGRPISVVASPSPTYRVLGEGRPRTWAELGGRTVAVIERVPAWASAPLSTVLREAPEATLGIPSDLLDHEGLATRPWFASPVSWDDVPPEARPSPLIDAPPRVHPHQQPRWQDRYATAAAHGTSPQRLLDILNRRAAPEVV